MDKKTALFDSHVAAGGKMVTFAGYSLPVEYEPTGLMQEHRRVRSACGLFDVSHMGEILFSGPGALATLNQLMTNDFSTMTIGQCRYTLLCYEDGGIVDDLIIYRLGEESFLAVVNASNKDKDFAWMKERIGKDTVIEDLSDTYAQLALQGPKAATILARLTDASNIPEKYYSFVMDKDVAGVACLISRTGYTGEDGFELYCSPDDAVKLWDALIQAGEADGLIPCGLGARDTLRLEAGMPLYGHEMDESISPFEVGLGFAVKMDKPSFVGKEALAEKGAPSRTRIGLEVVGRGIVREQAPLFFEGEQIGLSTSGTFCPSLDKACAMALVDTDKVSLDDEIEAEVRGRKIPARVVKLPFYRREQ